MVLYRVARQDDAITALAIRAAAITESLRASGATSSQLDAWKAAAEWPELSSETSFVVAEDAGVLVGYGYARGNQVQQLYVLPTEQRRGHGSRLLALLERSIALNRPSVELHAEPAAVAFYTAHGYQVRMRAQLWLSIAHQIEVVSMFKAL